MPVSALRPCSTVGCPALVKRGKCEACRKREQQHTDQARGTSSERGYDAAWQALRAAYLRANPLCECDECQAGKLKATAATVVDHRISIAERPDLRLVWSNLRSMSKTHHDRHTARTRGWGGRNASSSIPTAGPR